MMIEKIFNVRTIDEVISIFNDKPIHIKHENLDISFESIFTIDDIDYLLTVQGLRQPFYAYSNNSQGYTQFHDVQFQELLFGVCSPSVFIEEFIKKKSTLIIKHVNSINSKVNSFCSCISKEISPYTIQCNAYLAPPNTQGVAEHADPHHTLLIQLSGKKRWLVWDKINEFGSKPNINNVVHHNEAKNISKNKNPLIDMIINPGDILFIPRGFVHTPYTSNTHSLHLTLGIQENNYSSLIQKSIEGDIEEKIKNVIDYLNGNDELNKHDNFIEVIK